MSDRRKLVLGVAAAAALVVVWLLVGRWFTLAEVRSLVERGQEVAGTRPLLVAAALGGAICLSMIVGLPLKALLTLAAGALLGPVVGTAVIMVGAPAGTSVLFLLARTWLREAVQRRLGRRTRWLQRRLTERPIRTVAGLRLSTALPYGPVTLGAALSPISYRDFVVGSVLGDLPVVVLTAAAGERLAALSDPAQALSPATVAVLAAGAVLLLASALMRRRQEAASGQSDDDPQGATGGDGACSQRGPRPRPKSS